MTKAEFVNKLTRSYHKVGFTFKKHSPEILLGVGIVGTVASAVVACHATTKLEGILSKAKTDINTIHHVAENPDLLPDNETYTPEDAKKDLTIVYAKTGVEIAKLYAPAVILGALSITSILASHNILNKRNVALAAAYATVDNGFKEYRNRVIERFGKELDKELKYNIKAKEVEETVVQEDGTETTVKKTVHTADINETSQYARFFDEWCAGWTKDSEYNLTYLMLQESQANKMLQERGYLFLNDVYEMLGIPKTKAGQIVGWVYDEKCPVGDNYVDFGIHDVHDQNKRAFVNGYERSILLDFNVDGNILDLMA